jgi:hypothetical protein
MHRRQQMSRRLMRAHALTIIALGAMMVTTANAQATTTSTRSRRAKSAARIPVNKEPVAPDSSVKRDSTTAVNTAPAPAPAPAAAEPASTASAAPTPYVATNTPSPRMRMKRYGNGAYVGIGAGPGFPVQTIRNGYNSGYNIAIPIGWDAALNPFGFRIDLGYNRFGARPTFRDPNTVPLGAVPPAQSAQIYSAIADAKLRIPFTSSWFGNTTGAYAVAGGGLNHFRHYSSTFGLSNPEFNGSTTPDLSGSMTRFALNAGGGLWYGFRTTEVFVESRYVTTYMPNGRASFVPVVLGVNLY